MLIFLHQDICDIRKDLVWHTCMIVCNYCNTLDMEDGRSPTLNDFNSYYDFNSYDCNKRQETADSIGVHCELFQAGMGGGCT